MPMRTGIDIVCIPVFAVKLPKIRERAFHPSELQNEDPVHLAGIFAAKEALFKALNMPVAWLDVEVVYEGTRPKLLVSGFKGKVDVSIAHDGEYAVASVVVE